MFLLLLILLIILQLALPGLSTTDGQVLSCTGVDQAGNLLGDRATIPLHDIRVLGAPDLKTHGFTYVLRELPSEALNSDPSTPVYQRSLARDALAIVRKLTDSQAVFCYHAAGRGFGSGYEEPLPVIHSDMTPLAAEYTKLHLIPQHQEFYDEYTNTFRQKMSQNERMVIFNVWRPVKRVERDPLAICDWQTTADTDVVVTNNKVLKVEVQPWSYQNHQKWYYLPQQKPNEVLVFVQHDSAAGKHGMNIPHASPSMIDTPKDVPARLSYEFRIAAIVGEEFVLDHGRESQGSISSKRKRKNIFKGSN